MQTSQRPKRPTLGMILKGYPRISETFISNEILRLEEQGIRVHIISMRKPREAFCHDSVKEIKAQVSYLPSNIFRDFEPLALSAAQMAARCPEQFMTGLRFAGERFQESQTTGTIKHFLQAAYIHEHIIRKHPEICHLHAHFAHSPTSVALFASVLSGRPFSFTAHAKDIYTSKPQRLAEKMAQAQFVFTCTCMQPAAHLSAVFI